MLLDSILLLIRSSCTHFKKSPSAKTSFCKWWWRWLRVEFHACSLPQAKYPKEDYSGFQVQYVSRLRSYLSSLLMMNSSANMKSPGTTYLKANSLQNNGLSLGGPSTIGVDVDKNLTHLICFSRIGCSHLLYSLDRYEMTVSWADLMKHNKFEAPTTFQLPILQQCKHVWMATDKIHTFGSFLSRPEDVCFLAMVTKLTTGIRK